MFYRFWNLIGEKELYAEWMPNVEFSHIIVDKGMFYDHMPDSVLEAVESLYKQLCDSIATKSHHTTQDAQSNGNEPSVRYHQSNTEHNGLVEMNKGSNNTPQVNGHRHTVEVIVENNLQPVQEESTFV